jgi:hypothetical protein
MSAMVKPKVETLPAPNYPLHLSIAGISLRPFDFLPKQAPEKRPLAPLKMESIAKILEILLLKIRDESYSKKLPAATWNEVEKISELNLQVLPLQTKSATGSRNEIII